jgi:hypothetical protein
MQYITPMDTTQPSSDNTKAHQNQLRYNITAQLLEAMKPIKKAITYLEERETELRNLNYTCDICHKKIERGIIEVNEWGSTDFRHRWNRVIPDGMGRYHPECADAVGIRIIKKPR